MRKIVLGLILAMFAATSIGAQDTRAGAIEGVISGQIAALQADDFGAAFEFASPAIRRIFGDSDRFGTMVREGFPMVWRPGSVTFLELRDVGGQKIQRVMIRDQSGALHILQYQMIQAGERWQINGVHLEEGAEIGA